MADQQGCTSAPLIADYVCDSAPISLWLDTSLSTGGADCILHLLKNGVDSGVTFTYAASGGDPQPFTVPSNLLSAETITTWAVSNSLGTSNDVLCPYQVLPAPCTIIVNSVDSQASSGGFLANVVATSPDRCGPFDWSIYALDGSGPLDSGTSSTASFTSTNALPAGSYVLTITNQNVDPSQGNPVASNPFTFTLGGSQTSVSRSACRSTPLIEGG